ncbi:NAC transcription factor 29-like [Durio zibethinus]|uniref:NAC transcription factor 29-like n=1 Tax=Durio zibethinus TaxID=66656 RepID=A0A6P6AP86_DURZI|nr:NAC transcription factor 29-like [Durio zibethinus]
MYKPLTETEWYFFARRDRKYPKGYRLNPATPEGFWKKNCKKTITLDSKNDPIGYREFYAFFEMENQQVRSTDWRMHEYSIHNKISPTNQESAAGNGFQLDEWVLCRIYKKKDKNMEEEDNETLNPKLAQGHDLFDDYLQLTANNPFPYQKINGCFDDLEEVDLWSM